jgi:superfamily II DNA/RNA helicase
MEDFEDNLNKEFKKEAKSVKKSKGFKAFNLNNGLIESIKKIGYKFPTPIQRKAIPQIMSGFNTIAHSRTGLFFLNQALVKLQHF